MRGVAVLALAMLFGSMKGQVQIPLEGWRYSQEGAKEWRACEVPSLVQELLIKEERLPNPHYRTNERLVQGVEEQDWLYEADFELGEMQRLRQGERLMLELDGVDTYADVYVNGHRVGETENMFRAYRFDIIPYVQRGRNSLRIHLKSPIRMAKPLQAAAGFNYPADNDHAPIRYSPFTRKAPYHYGWDWGMRLVTMGIWRPVRLLHYRAEENELQHFNLRTEIAWQGYTARSAELLVEHHFAGGRGERFRLELLDPSGRLVHTQQLSSRERSSRISLKEPELWWPRGWGKASLYTLRLLRAKGSSAPLLEKRIGIREIQVMHQGQALGAGASKPAEPQEGYLVLGQGSEVSSPEERAESAFYFEVNKRPLFARGANYVPGDNLLTKRKDADFVRLFDDVEFAEMNMIRVWGGGVYEDERFYDEADRRGILVWQDFMFACTAYPADSAFLANVREEARQQILRLQTHPSIALWCGNNEVEEAIKYWGWQKKYSAEHYARMRDDYDPLFRQLLPELIAELAPDKAYVHSSPLEANWGRPESWLTGDSHYWGLWYGEQPFETFDDKRFAFVSEFGFQSFPDVPSLRQFALPKDMSLESEVMRQHQKASTGNSLIRKYMQRDYVVPERFERFVYTGLVMQARGMEHAIRSLRRHRPTTMGALIWQLNDAWPAVSWSSVDYYGNYKALHYRLREAFAPVAILPELRDGRLYIHAVNDGLAPLSDVILYVEQRLFSGRRLSQHGVSRETLGAGERTPLFSERLLADKLNESYYHITLESEGKTLQELRWYPVKPKDMQLPKAKYSWQLRAIDATRGEYQLEVVAESYVKDLWFSSEVMGLRFSDNLLDLSAGERRLIRITSPSALSPEALSAQALND